MLFDQKAPPAAPRLNLRPVGTPAGLERALETVLFRLPLTAALACGGCTRFKPINPFPLAPGRCRLGIKPGIVGRETTACNLHRAPGLPAIFAGRPVRP